MASGDLRKKMPTNFGVKPDAHPEPVRRSFDMNTGQFVDVPAPPRANNVAPGTRNIQQKPAVSFGNTLNAKNWQMTQLRQQQTRRVSQSDLRDQKVGDPVLGRYYPEDRS